MTLDANIIIAYLGGDSSVIDTLTEWRREGRPLFLSTVVETEILAFDSWSTEERKVTEHFLEENFTSIPFDRGVARVTAALRRDIKIKFPDAAIAGTALFTHTPVVTRNVKDFKKIGALRVIKI